MADGTTSVRAASVTDLRCTIDALVADAIERRIFPGAVVLVAQHARVLHHAAYGSTMYSDPDSVAVQHDTIYDIASLTKVFTATAVLRLLDCGALDLHAPAATYLPELQARGVTLWHLLTHTSGLDLRLSVLRQRGRAALLDAVYAAKLLHPPGSVVAYTNVNALLLGEIVARVWQQPLDRAIGELVLAPLGLCETRFRPPMAWLPRIAPTEHDPDWRGGLVHGSVHDESTHALGGVAGHAGLFSSAADVYTFCQTWLAGLEEEPSRQADKEIGSSSSFSSSVPSVPLSPAHLLTCSPAHLLRPSTARQATTNQTPGLTFACGLGWMIDRTNFMGNAPPGSFGHTGFTGPAMLVVPSQRLVVVVLSNRVYPQRRPPPYAHHAVTAAIVNAALEHGS